MEMTRTCGACRVYNWKTKRCSLSGRKIPFRLTACSFYDPGHVGIAKDCPGANEGIARELPGRIDQAAGWLATEKVSTPATIATIGLAVMVLVGNLIRFWAGG